MSSQGILHVCGDHPDMLHGMDAGELVFSTYVEVILNGVAIWQFCDSILHVCGGHPWMCCEISYLF